MTLQTFSYTQETTKVWQLSRHTITNTSYSTFSSFLYSLRMISTNIQDLQTRTVTSAYSHFRNILTYLPHNEWSWLLPQFEWKCSSCM